MITDGMSLLEIANEILLDFSKVFTAVSSKMENNSDFKKIEKSYNKGKKNLSFPCVYKTYFTYISKRKNKYLIYPCSAKINHKLDYVILCSYIYKGKLKYAFVIGGKVYFLSSHYVSRFKERSSKDDLTYLLKETFAVLTAEEVDGVFYFKSPNGLIPAKIEEKYVLFLTYMNNLSVNNKRIYDDLSWERHVKQKTELRLEKPEVVAYKSIYVSA